MAAVDSNDELMRAFAERANTLLEPCFSLVIEQTADYLFTLSASHRLDRDNQDRCFEAFTALQQASNGIVKKMLQDLQANWGITLSAQAHETATNEEFDQEQRGSELRLVDLNEFEDTLAIEKIVRVSTERFWLPLEAISIRLAQNLDCDPAGIHLPISPRAICVSYRSALETIEFPRQFLVDADSAFVRQLLPELRGIYDELAHLLADAGLSPNIEETLEATGSQFLIARHSREPSSRSPAPDRDAEHPDRKQVSLEVAEDEEAIVLPKDVSELAKLLVEQPDIVNSLLAQDKMTVGTSVLISNPSHLQTAASTEQLVAAQEDIEFTPERFQAVKLTEALHERALSNPGQLMTTNTEEDEAARDSDLLLVRDALVKLRLAGDLSAIDPSALIATMDLSIGDLAKERIEETIKLTGSLIQFVESRLGSRDSLTAAMTALKLMLIEVALVDKDFLLTSNHPSRLFLDRLVEYATLVTPGDTRAMTTIASLLMDLHSSFVGDADAFEAGVLKLEPLTIRLIKAKQQNVDRVISRESARELRAQAKKSLVRVLDAIPNADKLSDDVLDLFKDGLADSLQLKLLRGETESNISALLKPISMLWHSDFAGTELPISKQELAELTAAIDEAAGLEHERSAQLNATINRVLKYAEQGSLGSGDSSFDLHVDDTFAEQAYALKTRPRLRRKVETARRLPMRSWVSVRSDEAPHQFLQLVWKNNDSSRFAFTDERGKPRLVLSALELGSKIDRSISILSASQQLTLVEQTLFGRLKDAQSSLIETSAAPLSGVDMQIIDIERHLRRAKRKGTTQSLVVISESTEKLLSSIKDIALKRAMPVEAIHNGAMGIGTFIVDTVDSQQLDALIDEVQRDTGASITWHPLAGDISDARRLLSTAAAREPGDSKTEQVDLQQTEIDYRPIGLADAVKRTLQRLQQHLKPTPGVLPMFRIPVDHSAGIETSLLVTVDGAPDFSQQNDRDIDLFLQTDVIIAFDLYKVGSACRMLATAQDIGKALPNLHIRLSTETCLFGDAIDHLLSIISETGIGTEFLHFEFRDSVHIRLSKSAHDLSAALRSIGCKIIITDLNPARGDPVPLQRLRPHSVLFDSVFWHNAALEEPWLSLLPTVITDVHHLLNESVGLRDPMNSDRLADVGIDYIERLDSKSLSIEEYLATLPASSN